MEEIPCIDLRPGPRAWGVHLPRREVDLVEQLGIDGDYLEAASYAVMGADCLHSKPWPGRAIGGRTPAQKPVLGHIVQPPR